MEKIFIPDKIYIDMDGVLVDFSGGVRDILHMESKEQGIFDPAYNDMLFNSIRREKDFYLKLKPIPGSIDMVNRIIDKNGIDKVEILTGIPKPSRNIPEASENKKEWIKIHLNNRIKVNTVLRKDKINYIKGIRSVLIDDYISNVKEWEKHGGTAVLYKADDKNTVNELIKLNVL